jgi:dTDP-4-dehydrorhamnose 3,5-epimerase-like enzyme
MRRTRPSDLCTEGFARGFQTFADNAEIVYQISKFYAPDSPGGYRYDDVAFGIAVSRGRFPSQ